jgi:hypothetical protein
MAAFSTGGVIKSESLSDFFHSCRFSRIGFEKFTRRYSAETKHFIQPAFLTRITGAGAGFVFVSAALERKA